MNEVKTTLKRMAVYYLLLVISILFCANFIEDTFPTRNLSTIYLLALSVCLVLYYAHRVTPTGRLSFMMKSLSWMGLLLILLRGIKYSAFSAVDILARHTWYLYYVPILLLPLFLFFIALLVAPKDNARITKVRYSTLIVTVALVALVLTNDLHQQVFVFREGFSDWDSDYSHGWLFYVVNVWQFALYLSAIIILAIKCRLGSSKKKAWIILIPFALGIVMYALLLTEKMPKINGAPIIEFPEAHIFTAAVVLECCMQLGLIPTNTDYGKLFRNLSISAQITDRRGKPVFSSSSAIPLTKEQFLLQSGSRISEHTLLYKMPIPGGVGFWQSDMTELDRLNEELAEAKDALAEEAELIRLRNELKEKQTKIKQRTLVYDAIARGTQKQSQAISHFAEKARKSSDPAIKEEYRHRITLLGAYIKRYANLMLLSRESDVIEAGELGLSVSEVLRYLNYCGKPGEFIGGAECSVPADAALSVFEAFETLLEANYSCMKGVFVNLSASENVVFKLIFEDFSGGLSEEMKTKLSEAGVVNETKCEDGVSYIVFTMPKGGAV